MISPKDLNGVDLAYRSPNASLYEPFFQPLLPLAPLGDLSAADHAYQANQADQPPGNDFSAEAARGVAFSMRQK